MMRTNAEPGGTRYPFPVACINVMRMMATLLMVDTPPATASRLVLRSEKGSNVVLHVRKVLRFIQEHKVKLVVRE